jgi:hypothetical protein
MNPTGVLPNKELLLSALPWWARLATLAVAANKVRQQNSETLERLP